MVISYGLAPQPVFSVRKKLNHSTVRPLGGLVRPQAEPVAPPMPRWSLWYHCRSRTHLLLNEMPDCRRPHIKCATRVPKCLSSLALLHIYVIGCQKVGVFWRLDLSHWTRTSHMSPLGWRIWVAHPMCGFTRTITPEQKAPSLHSQGIIVLNLRVRTPGGSPKLFWRVPRWLVLKCNIVFFLSTVNNRHTRRCEHVDMLF